MSRLYDRIMANYHTVYSQISDVAGLQTELSELTHAHVILIDNIAEYFFQSIEKYAEWTPDDFPNVAPPFDAMWMEFGKRSLLGIFPAIQKAGGIPFNASGVFFDVVKTANWDDGWERNLLKNFPVLKAYEQGTAKWFISATLIQEREKHGPVEVRLNCAFFVDSTGKLIGSNRGNAYPFSCRLVGKSKEDAWDEADENLIATEIKGTLFPALLALSFLHCKNVKLIDNDPPAKLNKAYQKKRGRPLVRYHTLEIEPMKQILRHEGQSEKLGLKKALHICRGHFKDYTERPLFGKHHGLYWWDAHARGSLSEGAVVKDYAVKQPAAK